MARHRRTLEQALHDLSMSGRNDRTIALSTPAMEPVGPDAILPGAVTPEALAPELNLQLADNQDAISHLNDQLDTRLPALESDLEAVNNRIDGEVTQAINDAAASLVTDERFDPGSLTVWPFIEGTIPSGALAPNSVGSNEIADFSVAVTKLKSTRHHLY